MKTKQNFRHQTMELHHQFTISKKTSYFRNVFEPLMVEFGIYYNSPPVQAVMFCAPNVEVLGSVWTWVTVEDMEGYESNELNSSSEATSW